MNNEKVFLTHQSNIRFLLITANTGTVFEKPELLTAWVNEFANVLRRHPADFIALHCQEVGGKDYERYMHILDPFIKTILQIPEIVEDFTRYFIYFDSDYTSQDTFTALGSAYFIRENIPIQQWNFSTASFQNVVNRQIYAGNLVNVQTLRKEKFPREFFSESKWSRKGFTQTRWAINDFIFDMVNVHLFHDASNILAAEQSPSIYSNFRKNALQYTLRSLSLNPLDEPVPYVIFGDFNFRLDTHRLLPYIAEKRDGSIDRIKKGDSDEISRIVVKNNHNKPKLTIEKKEFNLHDDHDSFFKTDSQQFHIFDYETSTFSDQLFEYEKTFPPSYPYSEQHDEAKSYLRVRCPAWCDRILLSHSFQKSVDAEIALPTYNIVGEDVCMGDHKPVYLALTTRVAQGWSTSPSSLPTVFSSLSHFSSNCEDSIATSNIHLCDTLTTNSPNNNNNSTKSPVTVTRKTDLILNETPLLSDDINLFNIHDYAIFIQPALVPQWWFSKLQQRSVKTIHNSSLLWAKVRAVTYMTTLGHRTGSWYSDDQTEKCPFDDNTSSLLLEDNETNLPLNDIQDYQTRDLVTPLRRSFSSIDYVKHNERYSPTLSRSHSTTVMNTSDSPPTELPPPPPPISQPTSRVYRFLHCKNGNNRRIKTWTLTDNNTIELNSVDIMNNNSSLSPILNHSNSEDEDINNRKVTLISTTTTNNNNDEHRTVLARHIFQVNVKKTFTRWIRETPV